MQKDKLLSSDSGVNKKDTDPTFHEVFADWLSRPGWRWSWYITQTFDGRFLRPSDGLVKSSWMRWMKQLNRTAVASYGFVFGERGRMGRLHWHALVHVSQNILDQPEIKAMWEWGMEHYGRNSIFPYCHQVDVYAGFCATSLARYLTKYVAKDVQETNLYWDFTGYMGGRMADSKQIAHGFGFENGSMLPDVPGIPEPGVVIEEDDLPF